ncbi:hypothetical protein CRG98_017872 [Punica granatum]|uniref:Uncharacterized protein n=1 Tax=Punica granatum TaxID=22663 RepID=A0A2I0K0X3_PUNGR|nr:hypothetical protein CRG98_017872 [Punica granatum]
MEVVPPVEVEISSMRILAEYKLKEAEWAKQRYKHLNLIDEKRLIALCHGKQCTLQPAEQALVHLASPLGTTSRISKARRRRALSEVPHRSLPSNLGASEVFGCILYSSTQSKRDKLSAPHFGSPIQTTLLAVIQATT